MTFKKIYTKEKQSLLDLALQVYGEASGALLLLEDNPHLETILSEKLSKLNGFEEEDSVYKMNEQEMNSIKKNFSDNTMGKWFSLFFLQLPGNQELNIREDFIINDEAYTVAQYFIENNIEILTN